MCRYSAPKDLAESADERQQGRRDVDAGSIGRESGGVQVGDTEAVQRVQQPAPVRVPDRVPVIGRRDVLEQLQVETPEHHPGVRPPGRSQACELVSQRVGEFAGDRVVPHHGPLVAGLIVADPGGQAVDSARGHERDAVATTREVGQIGQGHGHSRHVFLGRIAGHARPGESPRTGVVVIDQPTFEPILELTGQAQFQLRDHRLQVAGLPHLAEVREERGVTAGDEPENQHGQLPLRVRLGRVGHHQLRTVVVEVVVVEAFHQIGHGPWQESLIGAPRELRHETATDCADLVHEIARDQVHGALLAELLLLRGARDLKAHADHCVHPHAKSVELSRVVRALGETIGDHGHVLRGEMHPETISGGDDMRQRRLHFHGMRTVEEDTLALEKRPGQHAVAPGLHLAGRALVHHRLQAFVRPCADDEVALPPHLAEGAGARVCVDHPRLRAGVAGNDDQGQVGREVIHQRDERLPGKRPGVGHADDALHALDLELLGHRVRAGFAVNELEARHDFHRLTAGHLNPAGDDPLGHLHDELRTAPRVGPVVVQPRVERSHNAEAHGFVFHCCTHLPSPHSCTLVIIVSATGRIPLQILKVQSISILYFLYILSMSTQNKKRVLNPFLCAVKNITDLGFARLGLKVVVWLAGLLRFVVLLLCLLKPANS